MENAFRSKLLSDPEYQVLKSWYEWIEKNSDITLDLIGKKKNPAKFCST